MSTWRWDPTLYQGSADYYVTGRVPYPPEIADALRQALDLDGTGNYLDVGCGPGSVTTIIAPLFDHAVGIDADPDMIRVAERVGHEAGVANVSWRCMRAEELPADLGTQRLVTFAQSFHWFDRAVVAAAVRGMLADGGALVHVQATNHQGIEGSTTPREQIAELVTHYLGSTRRAGRGSLPSGTADGEAAILRRAGFRGPERVEVPRGYVVHRTEDEIVASVFSLSGSAPHLFGDRVQAFEADLRALLRASTSDGMFRERLRDVALDIWR